MLISYFFIIDVSLAEISKSDRMSYIQWYYAQRGLANASDPVGKIIVYRPVEFGALISFKPTILIKHLIVSTVFFKKGVQFILQNRNLLSRENKNHFPQLYCYNIFKRFYLNYYLFTNAFLTIIFYQKLFVHLFVVDILFFSFINILLLTN